MYRYRTLPRKPNRLKLRSVQVRAAAAAALMTVTVDVVGKHRPRIDQNLKYSNVQIQQRCNPEIIKPHFLSTLIFYYSDRNRSIYVNSCPRPHIFSPQHWISKHTNRRRLASGKRRLATDGGAAAIARRITAETDPVGQRKLSRALLPCISLASSDVLVLITFFFQV